MAKQSEQATDITQPNTRQAKFPFINEIMTGIIPHRRNGNNKKTCIGLSTEFHYIDMKF